MSDESAKPTSPFVWWWLGGFGLLGAIGAGALAVLFGSGFLASLGIAVLGAIVGLSLGVGIAEAVVLIADGLGWDEKPQTSRIDRVVRHRNEVIDQVTP
jgi:hypothetical protein